MSGAMQYTQAWLQPLYGLTVQSNGTRETPGTRFSADFVRISWKRMSSASGASKRRTTTSSRQARQAAGVVGVHGLRFPAHEHMFA